MRNIFTKIGLIGLILLTGILTVSAQESTTLQFMKGMPQSALTNPALHNDSSKVVIGLPGLSGISFGFNSDFAIHDLIHKGTGMLKDSDVWDIENFHGKLKSTNSVELNTSIPLLFLGFRNKKSFFSLGITEKVVAQVTFDKSLVTFIKDGNAPYIGQNFDLGKIGINTFGYREYAFGYSNEFLKDKLTIGVKAKFLSGEAAFHTERMNMKVETAADQSYLNLSTDMDINISAPVTVKYDENDYFDGMNGDNFKAGDYLNQKGNSGMAFDFGAVYKLTPKITLSGSIIDLGKISFKKNLISMKHTNTYKWDGVDFSNSVDDSKGDYVDPSDLFDNETDKMKDSFKPKKSEFGAESFDMTLPTKIFLGGTYEVNKIFNVGLLDCIYKNGDVSRNTITASGNAQLCKFFSLSGSYSNISGSSNVGLGMAMRLGAMQLYFVSDNVLALNDLTKTENTNFRFGMNFLFGRN